LPAALELTPAESHYIDVATIPGDGRVVLLGTYEGMKSPVPYAQPVTYLHVRLRAGEAWRYEPAGGHDVAWLAVSEGALRVDGQTVRREIAIFEDASEDASGDQSAIDVVAATDVELIGGEVSPPTPQETRLGDKPQSGFLFEAQFDRLRSNSY
jgi:redox-sensitive bicupin YhaK (pirin superfamily)